MNSPSNLLPLRLMARRLRVKAKWLKAEALSGRIPHLNADGELLFHPESVEVVLTALASRLSVDKREVGHVR